MLHAYHFFEPNSYGSLVGHIHIHMCVWVYIYVCMRVCYVFCIDCPPIPALDCRRNDGSAVKQVVSVGFHQCVALVA